MKSALYKGTVLHRRLRPVGHLLSYKIFYLLIDLDEMDIVSKGIPFFSIGKRNLVAFMEKDFADKQPGDLKQKIIKTVRSEGVTAEISAVRLLCIPRIFGYAFNPLSIYYCYDDQDQIVSIVYEVSNTFGERHSYVFSVDGANTGKSLQHSCRKEFYVSPFIPMNCEYNFSVLPPNEKIALSIRQLEAGAPLLNASFVGSRESLSAASLGKHLLKFPFNSVKVIAGIHWEALKLWIKGIKLVDRPADTSSPMPANRQTLTSGLQEK